MLNFDDQIPSTIKIIMTLSKTGLFTRDRYKIVMPQLFPLRQVIPAVHIEIFIAQNSCLKLFCEKENAKKTFSQIKKYFLKKDTTP